MAGDTTLAKKSVKVNGRTIALGTKRLLPIGTIFVEPHADRPQFLLLPTVLGAFEPARKLFRAGHRLGYEFRTAFRALHRSRILFDRLTSIGYKYSFKNAALLKRQDTRETPLAA
jgi:hypothetical protein